MKLRFKTSHEHANSERRCTSDLTHALLTAPMMLRMQMLTAREGKLSMKFHAIGDSRPSDTLLKEEGRQLAEASFREKYEKMIERGNHFCRILFARLRLGKRSRWAVLL